MLTGPPPKFHGTRDIHLFRSAFDRATHRLFNVSSAVQWVRHRGLPFARHLFILLHRDPRTPGTREIMLLCRRVSAVSARVAVMSAVKNYARLPPGLPTCKTCTAFESPVALLDLPFRRSCDGQLVDGVAVLSAKLPTTSDGFADVFRDIRAIVTVQRR